MQSKNPVIVAVHFIHRYFIWVIVGSYLVAAALPAFGLWIRDVDLGSLQMLQWKVGLSLPLLMLATLLFNAGLGVNIGELKQLAHKPQLLLGGLIGNIGTPLIFIIALSFVMGFWHNPEEVQQILVGLVVRSVK